MNQPAPTIRNVFKRSGDPTATHVRITAQTSAQAMLYEV
jgi:hypothetical protein